MNLDNAAPYIAFFALSAMVLFGGLAVVTLRNLLHSVLCMALCFIGVAGLYLMLQAEFLAVVQVLIYIGAILVLILFAVMLTERLTDKKLRQFTGKWWLAAPLALLLFAALIVPTVLNTTWLERPKAALPENAVQSLGQALMTEYVLPFEAVSVLLLAALVGAIVVAWPMRDRLPVVEELEAKIAQARAGWKRGQAEEGPAEEAAPSAEVEEQRD